MPPAAASGMPRKKQQEAGVRGGVGGPPLLTHKNKSPVAVVGDAGKAGKSGRGNGGRATMQFVKTSCGFRGIPEAAAGGSPVRVRRDGGILAGQSGSSSVLWIVDCFIAVWTIRQSEEEPLFFTNPGTICRLVRLIPRRQLEIQ
jgi:hypothetical protein